ncbi:MAG TPA: CopD family protein [Solirubrobacteraceae bacterium]|nr:CopD family protein [Solirubrobacteraceae bacterium]
MLQRRQSLALARIPRMPCALAAILIFLLAIPAAAFGHAQLLGTVPQAGSTVPRQPPLVIFEYNEAVGFTLGAVRVYDARGDEVDDSDVAHPRGIASQLGVGLKPGLPDGTYTATYSVISADTHVVTGGLVFDIGHPSESSLSVSSLIARDRAGDVTTIAFSVVRGLDYVSLALALGGLAFLWLAWGRGIRALAGDSASPAGRFAGDTTESDATESEAAEYRARRLLASRIFTRRIERFLAYAVALGIVTGEFGILLEGASAAGVPLWSSLHWEIVRTVLGSRFGWVWGSRTVVWIGLGLLLAAAVGVRRTRERRGDEAAPAEPHRPPAWVVVAAAAACVYLAMTPGLSSHPSVQSPVWVLFPADVIHVLAVSIWVGGIAAFLFALPISLRALEPTERTPVLCAVLGRFSAVALVCVVAIALTGGIQALVLVRTLDGLIATAYGRAILIKVVLFVVLVGFGVIHRKRIIPALERLARAGATPGGSGALLRRMLRREGITMLGVFGVTAALIAYTPPVDANSGPFSTTTTIGPAELELTVDPASVGPNEIHVYLIDAQTGAQFTRTVELDVTASLPAKRIGPLTVGANLSGPGHYTLDTTTFAPAGTWQLQITDRVSAFDEYVKTVDVPIH